MAQRVVGVDIGSFAVRAAEITVSGNSVTLNRFGQVTLPPDAVRDGEVIDVAAVSAALRRLWSEVGFKQKKVVVGVANQRAIVRQAEVSAMSEEDFRSAIRFEAQELIPIPVDDAVLDFRILDRFSAGDGDERMRILLAAAQRDMVRSHLAALEGAGLRAEAVDGVPFALVRALADRTPVSADATPVSEAIVCIGGSVTSIVVHHNGVPRFVRVLLVGGTDITEAVARELDVDMERAEDLKRRSAVGAGDMQVLQATKVMSNRLAPFVEEIRGSLDYYLAQSDSAPIDRVVVTGGGSRMTGLIERLEHQLRTEVVAGRPLAGVKVDDLGLSPEQMANAEALLAVPLGLALPDYMPLDGTRRISLIPQEAAEKNARRRSIVMGGLAVAAVTGGLLMLWFGRQAQIVTRNNEAKRNEQQATRLQAEVNRLAPMAKLETDLASGRKNVQTALTGDVAWTKVITDVSATMPNETWISSFSGTKAAGQAGATGQVTFAVSGVGHPSAAAWLQAMATVPHLTGVWVPSVSLDAGTNVATFSSSAKLTPQAASNRIAAFQPGKAQS